MFTRSKKKSLFFQLLVLVVVEVVSFFLHTALSALL